MENKIYQIYDKMFKKILTLSSKAVINMINGLYDTDYPPDSAIHYQWTEFEDDGLKKILADTILTINNKDSYHMEAQMTKDDAIIFRIFEYSFSHANRSPVINENFHELKFPEPKIIFLAPEGKLPDRYVLRLNFGTQGSFDYQTSVFHFNQISVKELNRKKMVILIPFKLLTLRKALAKSRSAKNLELLKNLIQNDIIGSIDENLRLDNITPNDAHRLKGLTQKLYHHIYAHYEELEDLTEMTDESIMLDIDILEKKYERQLAEYQETLDKNNSIIKQQHAEIHALLERIRQLEQVPEKE